MKALFTS